MRAKRNTEVKELETTVSKLQDRNKKLEAQNKEYAKTLQQLQEEMCNLRTQLQGSLCSSHQQHSSSEVHQVSSGAPVLLVSWAQRTAQEVCQAGAGRAAVRGNT
jgi:septal ring factor EnvC (AmiA/AmiB activator)